MNANLKLNLETLTLKTFLRGFLVVVFFVLLLMGIAIEQGPFRLRLREGDIALKSIYAPYYFIYTGAIDEIKTEQERQKARNSVKEVYSADPKPQLRALARLEKFFQSPEAPGDISLSVNSTKAFVRAQDKGRLYSEAADLLRSVYAQGVLVKDEAVRDIHAKAKKVLFDKRMVSAVSELIQNLIEPNMVFEEALTESKRKLAADAVQPQYQEIEVKKGELIIAKGQRVSKVHIAQLVSIEGSQSEVSRVKFLAGISLLVFLLLFVVTVYLALYEPKIFHNTSYLSLIGILAIFIIFVSRAIIISPLPSYLIPLSSVSMLLAILLNPRLAIFVTVALSIAISINVQNSLNLAVMFLFGGLVSIFSTRNIRRRWHIIRSGILAGAANAASIVTIGLLNNLNFDTFVTDSIWGFVNGIICIFIVMGILPLLEDLFKMATDITLLELSDMNSPLLKELMLKAPGTYHHSLMVGNLAEAAAEAVGANSLLSRVGAYYHDVGKAEKAEYFAENQANVKSLHDRLTPSMSRLVITNHVKDGVELARRYRLKKPILDFIEQHHGTGLVYYFFQKALERVEDEAILSQEGYRYSGPKPQTKETAIVLLADSVEAASRTLANPTQPRIEELVHRIINNKFIDGQLEECELTLKDLNRIADAFIRVLIGVLHSRVEYPGKNED